jgi:DNA methylase
VVWNIECRDCIDFLNAQAPDSLDLVFGSPPYTDCRTYGLEDVVRGPLEWVDWMLEVTKAAVRACKGLVLWVVAGPQRQNCYWPACEGLLYEWWKRGGQCWRPCVWWKVDVEEGGSGIPGSGGKQWLRNDWEYVLAFKREGWLPWADPLVMGHEPIIDHLGGEMSNRTVDGQRINARVGGREKRQEEWNPTGSTRRAGGEYKKVTRDKDVWKTASRGGSGVGGRTQAGVKKQGPKGNRCQNKGQKGEPKENTNGCLPKIANPGNCVIVKARVGGGHMGSRLCHENEAPYPEALAEFFVRSFCPPGGLCCDPFSGSGTTAAVAVRWGRNFTGCDIRESQVLLGQKRVRGETPDLFP